MRRRLVLAALSLAFAGPAAAQSAADYPNRPIRIIVPQAAGSGVDFVSTDQAQAGRVVHFINAVDRLRRIDKQRVPPRHVFDPCPHADTGQ